MADIDLSGLSLKELKKLHKDIDKAIVDFTSRQKAEARAKVEDLARELGFNFSDLASIEAKKSRAPAQAKFRSPGNSSVTWTGRGRKPNWFIEAIASGMTPEDLLI